MVSQRADRVVVIGGGLGGLAAACTLAARGHGVVLLERNAWLGGKAAVLEADGFRFDMGPTILTLPSVLARVFSEADRILVDYLDMVPLDPQWRCFFDDGSTLDLEANVERMAAAVARFSPHARDAAGYRQFLEHSRRLHDISRRYFFWKNVGSLRDQFDLTSSFRLATVKDVLALRLGRSVSGTIRSYVRDPRVAQLLDHFTQYVGSAPDASPAVLCGIAHMQTEEGIWYPRGGTRAVAVALERLAGELGVEVRLGCGVERIVVEKGAVRGVQTTGGELLEAGSVVANSDSVLTHRDLIGEAASRPFLQRRSYEPACSGVVFYWGLTRAYEHLLHHNFVFSHDAHQEFQAIYREGNPARDPTCYVCAPARTEPDVAPPGGEALYVLVHTPYLRPHHDWDRLLPAYRRVVLDKLAATAGLGDLESRIAFERVLTPADIQSRYQVLQGAIYGLASHGRVLGAFKPANRSPDIKGLYLAGGSAHPGPGMPMVLMSGWIAADALDRDRRGGPVAAEPALASASRAVP